MTRINVGILPRLLSDKHLLAEHREIKRIPNHLAKHGDKCLKNAPKKFTLGTGHFLFFIDKGAYTKQRYVQLKMECRRRGFKVADYSSSWGIYGYFDQLYNTWKASPGDTLLICERLQLRDPVYYKHIYSKVVKIPKI